MTNVGAVGAALGAALIVAASILGAAYVVKPLTTTEKCWDISTTWERRQKAGDRVFGSMDPQAIYAGCLVHEVGR